jgi:hypothetical protein
MAVKVDDIGAKIDDPRDQAAQPSAAANPAGASRWPSLRPVRRVAELGSLIWLEGVKQAVLVLPQKVHRFRFIVSAVFLSQRQERFFLRCSMLRCVSPLAALARREVIHLPRSDAARCFHTRLQDQPRGCLQRPSMVGALTGSLPLVQKILAGSGHLVFWFFFASLSKLFTPFSGAASPAGRWPRQSPRVRAPAR